MSRNQSSAKFCNLSAVRADLSPLRYPGGKRRLATIVSDLISRHVGVPALFVEPFVGGGAVSVHLLETGAVGSVALSDLDELIGAFWRVVFSPHATALAERVRNADVCIAEWHRQRELVPANDLDAAFKCLFLNRTSFSGSIKSYAGPMGGKTQERGDLIGSRFNRERIASRIEELSLLSDRIRFVRTADFRTIISELRTERDAVWYMDPPYVEKASRLYRHSFREDDHRDLADLVRTLERFIVSYDDHPVIRRLYADFDLRAIQHTYSARAMKDGRSKGREILITNMSDDVSTPLTVYGRRTNTEGTLPVATFR